MSEHPPQDSQPDPQQPAEDLRSVIARAFDYRGDVTVTMTDGKVVEGYIFDRRDTGPQPQIRIMPVSSNERVTILYDQIAEIKFTGKDTAAGKSWETWVKKYEEKKAKGEKASMDPEPLE